jgi:UDP-glucose 4-epimerase
MMGNMKPKSQTILVTGGAGFIGSHLVESLVSRGYHVKVLDPLLRGSLVYLNPLIKSGKIEYIDGDVRYKDAVDKAMKDVDYVFHMAATNIRRSIAYPDESFDINFKGSQVVFKSALDHGVKRVIYPSTASVYGEPKKLPMAEDSELNPKTPYGISKVASEYLLKFYTRFGLNYNILRYFNVYGLRQHTDHYYTSVIILFLKKIMNNEAPEIHGSGEQSMDFVNVKDIVRATIMAMESEVENEIFNIGSGKSTTIKEMAFMLTKFSGKKVKPKLVPRETLVTKRRADTTKAKKLLGFEAKIDIETGLKEVVQDIMKHPERY